LVVEIKAGRGSRVEGRGSRVEVDYSEPPELFVNSLTQLLSDLYIQSREGIEAPPMERLEQIHVQR